MRTVDDVEPLVWRVLVQTHLEVSRLLCLWVVTVEGAPFDVKDTVGCAARDRGVNAALTAKFLHAAGKADVGAQRVPQSEDCQIDTGPDLA